MIASFFTNQNADRAQHCALLTKQAEWVITLLGNRRFLTGKNLTYLDFALVEMFEILQWLSEG
jgi:glutathione S-transferase